ncbi:MAG: isopentenyl-diphosphate delta-isomerase [Candidatus Moranbacteria bacterium RIFOXYA12_FULL_44_15]|nr:MAG: isopentenyl-diphosphate delta-isomerase [Candidatus Moranbacteria bacterium RIFOXYA12_FULL_44_15]OGI34264.1 MAG: isopentenyl-diphosphate delta-isomerase [Candidatus Moranbacteria bacterium RIFOXYA2_FULL_43_15]
MPDEIILVDENDREIGTKEKMEVHRKGLLHRCFSILLYNSKGEMMLQRRAAGKYHCGGLWTNVCCSHPRPGEDVISAGKRRLKEEMGIKCGLKEVFSFTYRAEFANGLTEHEFDHVLVGKFDGEPKINPEEADGWRWIGIAELRKEIQNSPEKFTPWFGMILDKI